jgi:polar amino acid transport system substrate-binding protein
MSSQFSSVARAVASAAARSIRQLGIFELLIFMMLQPGLALAQTITVATQNNEPYEAQVDGQVVGLFSEIVTAAFKKVDVDVVYAFVPWKRAYLMAKDGNADATMPWYKTVDREQDFLFSDPVVLTVNKFFIVKDRSIPTDFQWNSVADFKKFRVGGVDGYWYQEEFRKNGIQLDLAMSDRLNVKKLRDGRFDTFVADELIGWYLIGNEFPGRTKEFATLDKPESVCSSHLIAAKRNAKSMALISEFNRGLLLLIESGEYDRIRRKYAVNIQSPGYANDLQKNALGCK